MAIIIYHNPRCQKSRQTLDILNQKAKDKIKIIEYLKNPPTKKELDDILSKLQKKPIEIVRKNEGIYKEFYAGKEMSDEDWLEALSKNPILIERPIVIKGNKAVIGRPPENVLEII